jgi:hypothetical protein
VPSIESLGEAKEARLRELEAQVSEGLSASIRVGKALREIRDDQLYLVDYATFQEYCEERWEVSRGHAYRLIEAAEIVARIREVSPKGDVPRHETHARALAPLKDRPKDMAEAWREARGDGEHITADAVRRAVARRQGPPGAAEPPPTPVPEPTPIEAAVADTQPESEGTHHYTTGLIEALLAVGREAKAGQVCVIARPPGEVEIRWRDLEGNPSRKTLNRHGNVPQGERGAA